jgi:competence protein ComEA
VKPLLLGDRATSAVPARSSRLSRFSAWVRESLLARAIAAVIALFALAFIGGSAVAGGNAAKLPSPSAPSASPSLASSPVAAAAPVPSAPSEHPLDAGAIPTTTPELLPRAPLEPVDTPNESSGAPASGRENLGRATPDDPVDLNTARIEDLRRLPGIGAKRAEAILALRARLPGGRFRQIEELLKVKGVGRAMIKRLHPLVRFSGG